MATVPFKSKMPADFGSQTDGNASTQDIAYIQAIEQSVNTLTSSPAHDDTKADKDQAINSQTGTSYTLVLTDDGTYCTFTNASAITAIVPPNSSVAFPIGARIDWKQDGAGKLTWAQGPGVTINSFLSNKSAAGQHAGGTLIQTTTDVWDLFGTLTA